MRPGFARNNASFGRPDSIKHCMFITAALATKMGAGRGEGHGRYSITVTVSTQTPKHHPTHARFAALSPKNTPPVSSMWRGDSSPLDWQDRAG